MKKIVVFIIITILILLAPIPYYLRSGECEECLPNTPCRCGPRFFLGIPIWLQVTEQFYRFTSSSTFFPVYNFFHSVPKDIWCKKDEDCAVNTCNCMAVRKDSLQSKNLICTLHCPGIPVCNSGRCMLNTTKSTRNYSCPPGEWVNCMPGPDTKPECSAEAMAWYKINCPNFKGRAL